VKVVYSGCKELDKGHKFVLIDVKHVGFYFGFASVAINGYFVVHLIPPSICRRLAACVPCPEDTMSEYLSRTKCQEKFSLNESDEQYKPL
jgi:hypothetical protein